MHSVTAPGPHAALPACIAAHIQHVVPRPGTIASLQDTENSVTNRSEVPQLLRSNTLLRVISRKLVVTGMIQVPVHIHLTLAFRLATLEVELSVVSLPHWTERSLSPETAGLELLTLAGVKRSA